MNRVRTRTGLEIGAAYTRPPPQPSADAERIQAALLDQRRSHILGASHAMRKVTTRAPRPIRLRAPMPLRWARALWRWLCAPSPWGRRS